MKRSYLILVTLIFIIFFSLIFSFIFSNILKESMEAKITLDDVYINPISNLIDSKYVSDKTQQILQLKQQLYDLRNIIYDKPLQNIINLNYKLRENTNPTLLLEEMKNEFKVSLDANHFNNTYTIHIPTGDKGPQGPIGEKGDIGDAGEKGERGPDGYCGIYIK